MPRIDATALSRRAAYRPPGEERATMPFGDMVYLLAESVAEAQTKLDAETVEVMKTLAETDVEVVPRVTRAIEDDGSVTTTSAPPEEKSLLELGFEPTRYQFSEATVSVDYDLHITEESESESEREGPASYGLRAGTYQVQEQRKYSRDLQASAHLEATLEPVPMPVGASPAETPPEDGE